MDSLNFINGCKQDLIYTTEAFLDLSISNSGGKTSFPEFVSPDERRKICQQLVILLAEIKRDQMMQKVSFKKTINFNLLQEKQKIIDNLLAKLGAKFEFNNALCEATTFVNQEKGLSTVEELFQKGKDPNLCDDEGRLPLQTALCHFNKDIASYLLEKGADPCLKNAEGITAFFYLWFMGDNEEEAIALSDQMFSSSSLSSQEILAMRDATMRTPLHFMMHSCPSAKFIRYLVVKGADLNALDNVGRTPLHEGVCNSSERCVRDLIAVGANLNLTGRDGITPLALALSRDYHQIAKLLIERGAVIDAKSLEIAYNSFHMPADCALELLHKGDFSQTAMSKFDFAIRFGLDSNRPSSS